MMLVKDLLEEARKRIEDNKKEAAIDKLIKDLQNKDYREKREKFFNEMLEMDIDKYLKTW